MTESWAFLKRPHQPQEQAKSRRRRRTKWVPIWDQWYV